MLRTEVLNLFTACCDRPECKDVTCIAEQKKLYHPDSARSDTNVIITNEEIIKEIIH